MSEQDYQRGLRGGDCTNYDGQHYTDWLTGYREYVSLNKDIEQREAIEMDKYYSTEEQKKRMDERLAASTAEVEKVERYYRDLEKSDKENAYKSAEEQRSSGWPLLLSIIFFIIILIVGFFVVGFLELFKIHIPSIVIWVLAILPAIILFWVQNKYYKEAIKEANEKYGKR